MAKHRDKEFGVPVFIKIKGFDSADALKETHNAIQDGLIDPGFIIDGSVVGDPVEIDSPVKQDAA